MSGSNNYWTLDQAAAWVVFRDISIVDKFASPSPEDFGAFMMYDATHPKKLGSVTMLIDALKEGSITAFGRVSGSVSRVEEIPNREWFSLMLDLPNVYILGGNGEKERPWRDVGVNSKDVLTLWPHPDRIPQRKNVRARGGWRDVADRLIKTLRANNPASLTEPDRKLAERLTRSLKAELNEGDVPKDRSLREYLSSLRRIGDLPPHKGREST
jgi:hypothetical protein